MKQFLFVVVTASLLLAACGGGGCTRRNEGAGLKPSCRGRGACADHLHGMG